MSESRTLLPVPLEPGTRLRLLDVNPRLPAAVNRFGCELFVRLRSRGEENTLLSPLSVWLALAMAWFGAENETAEELGQILHLNSFDKEQLQADAEAFLGFMRLGDPDGQVSIANSAWMRNTVELREQYVRRMTSSLHSGLFTRDFGDPRVVDEVNRWVRDQTRGRIEGIVGSLDPPLARPCMARARPWRDPGRAALGPGDEVGSTPRACGCASRCSDHARRLTRVPWCSPWVPSGTFPPNRAPARSRETSVLQGCPRNERAPRG